MGSSYDPDVDKDWSRTLRRTLLILAEGHASRDRSPVSRRVAIGAGIGGAMTLAIVIVRILGALL